MKNIERTISDIIDTEYHEYAMYTLEHRAIPSVIDGFKPVHRKLVYAMINEYKGKKTKIQDIGSISRFNYHHGEVSAMGAAVTLTAAYNNNCPVFTGHGNFGTRLIQEASAPRYIFASLSQEFKKYFIDEDVAPKSLDEENPEPQFYLPTIPWVLINSIEGIATGFATSILPHSIATIISEVKRCLKNPDKYLADNLPVKPTFPDFKGIVEQLSPSQWQTKGIVEYVGKYTYKISELPIGYDRESYVNVLNNLIDADKIKDYEDGCSEEGFGFSIKVSVAQKEKIEQDPYKYFKLTKTHSENLTTLGIDGKLKIFNSNAELIYYFCQYRLTKFRDKIDYEIKLLEEENLLLTDKAKFIGLVINRKIDFRELDKTELLRVIEEKVTKNEYSKTFIYIPLYNCTSDSVDALQMKIKSNNDRLYILRQQTPLDRFLEVL